jgi:tRNA/rRNA methyltransferase
VLEGTPEPVAMAPARAVQAGAEPAQHATVEALWDRARAVLSRTGFLNPQNPEHILADLRRLISRAEPTQREVELVLAALRTIERKLD